MSTECKSYKVTIFGNEYTLISDEPFEAVCNIALQVDASMSEIADKTKLKEVAHIAVLAALKATHALNAYKCSAQDATGRHESLVKQIDQVLKMVETVI